MRTAHGWGMVVMTVLVALAAGVLASAASAATMPSQTTLGEAATTAQADAAAERAAVQAALVKVGLTQEQAAERVQLLTDAEVHALAARADSIRAGGAGTRSFSLEEVLLIAILVILIVD
jgi:hypothetical protein